MEPRRIQRNRLKSQELTVGQIECLASRVRDKLLVLFCLHGPCSIKEIAKYFDTYPEGLYHHVKKMVAAGIVDEVATRRSGHRDESVYDVVANNFKLKSQPWSADYIAAAQSLFHAMFTQKMSECRHAVGKFCSRPESNTFVYVRHLDFDLDRSRIKELRAKLDGLNAWLTELKPNSRSRTHTVFVAAVPIEKLARGKARPTARRKAK